MEKLTLKDFILYNSPCFSCDNKISLKMGIFKIKSDIPDNYNSPPIILKPIIGNNYIDIDLKFTYKEILRLRIFCIDNSFQTTSEEGLTDYLARSNLFLESYCDKCYSLFTSKLLSFNLNQKILNPIELRTEHLTVSDNKYVYYIKTDYVSKDTIVDVFTINHDKIPLHYQMPMLPLSKFQTKEYFFNKMQLYISFN